jgi:hypothetical protein
MNAENVGSHSVEYKIRNLEIIAGSAENCGGEMPSMIFSELCVLERPNGGSGLVQWFDLTPSMYEH